MAESVPVGVPPEAAEAARATLGGALAAAERLPDGLGVALLGPAREAFTDGMQLTVVVCAAVAVAAATVGTVLLRRARESRA
jgi:DHA2 family multidrug resistance protein-like MFS transporter